MTALYIIVGTALFILALLMLRAEIVIAYAGGSDVYLTVRVLGIPIRIMPAKKKRLRLRSYTPRARERAAARQKKKDERRARRDKKKQDKKRASTGAQTGKQTKKKSLTDNISLITDIVGTAFGRFRRHIRIRVARLHIAVATGDAATTAITYGIVVQAAAYLAALLQHESILRRAQDADVDIHADYLSEQTAVDVEIGLALRVWNVIDILLRSLVRYVKH